MNILIRMLCTLAAKPYKVASALLLTKVRKEINAHGVSVVRIQLENNMWKLVDTDPLNRRYTGATVMDLSGQSHIPSLL